MARLLQQFYNVTVLCPPPTYPFTKHRKAKYLFHREVVNGIKVVRIWTYQPSKQIPSFLQRILYYITFPILASIFLFTTLSNVSFVIVTAPPPSLLITSLIVKLFNKKLILDIRDLFTDSVAHLGYVNKKSILTKITKRFEIYCWKISDLIISNSIIRAEIIRQILVENNSSKIKYFPFNVDLSTFKRINVKRAKQIVYVGNFGVGQNLKQLINAMPIILSKIPDLKLQFYGGGDCELELKKLAADLNLEQSIKFNNPVPREDIPLILSQSLLGIVPILTDNPYIRDAVPTKTFEYFACGLPVLAYGYSDELERVIKESGAGVYIRNDDHKEIADRVIEMINDQSMLDEYSINGRKFVERQITFPLLP